MHGTHQKKLDAGRGHDIQTIATCQMVFLHRVSYKFDFMLFQAYAFWFLVGFNHIVVLFIVPFLTDKCFRVTYIIFASHEIMHLYFNANITMNIVTFYFLVKVKSIRMETLHLQKKKGKRK